MECRQPPADVFVNKADPAHADTYLYPKKPVSACADTGKAARENSLQLEVDALADAGDRACFTVDDARSVLVTQHRLYGSCVEHAGGVRVYHLRAYHPTQLINGIFDQHPALNTQGKLAPGILRSYRQYSGQITIWIQNRSQRT